MSTPAAPPPGYDPRFDSPATGAKAILEYRDTWSTTLGTRSVEACYAIIVAVWAVHGQSGILQNGWAIAATILALAHLAASLLVVLWVVTLLNRRFRASQENPDAWKQGWETSVAPQSRWPYTLLMERIGAAFNWGKALVPGAAALALIISFFCG